MLQGRDGNRSAYQIHLPMSLYKLCALYICMSMYSKTNKLHDTSRHHPSLPYSCLPWQRGLMLTLDCRGCCPGCGTSPDGRTAPWWPASPDCYPRSSPWHGCLEKMKCVKKKKRRCLQMSRWHDLIFQHTINRDWPNFLSLMIFNRVYQSRS